jgi:hypothetical protein
MGCGSDGGVVLLSSQSCQLLEGMREGSELARRLSRVGSERVEHIRTSNFMLEVCFRFTGNSINLLLSCCGRIRQLEV